MLVELDIVIAALKADFCGLDASTKCSYQKNELNVSSLFELAHHHGCIWEVVAYCKFHGLLNEEEVDVARLLTMQSTAHAMQNEQVLIRVLKIFEKNDLHYAVLKGAAIYPQFRSSSEQQSRQSADIDVLVSSNDVGKAVEILLKQGYQSNDCSDPLLIASFVQKNEVWFRQRDLSFSLSDKSIHVDLHWRVAYPFSLPMKTPDLLRRAETVNIQKYPIKCLSFNDHFLLLCIHGYLDQFFILKHLVDIYWAKQHSNFDEARIRLLAKTHGVQIQFESSCATANLFFDHADSRVSVAEERLVERSEIEGSIEPFSEYAVSTMRRYKQFLGKPPRMHQGKGFWSYKDKLAYIKHQMNTRSQNASILAPLIHRLKYDVNMIEVKPHWCSVSIGWPFAYIKKLFF